MFGNAIEMDPKFALAHSGLGISLLEFVLKGMGGLDYYGRAKKSFDLALQQDSTLVEPRVRLVYIDLIEGKSERARAEIARLLRHAPNEPSVHSPRLMSTGCPGGRTRPRTWDRLLKINHRRCLCQLQSRTNPHLSARLRPGHRRGCDRIGV
jgi:serine/threonine-protein kinase